jgi:hypothetical protein
MSAQKPKRDRRTRFARRRWPVPFSPLESVALAVHMSAAATPLLWEIKRPSWWKRWLGKR